MLFYFRFFDRTGPSEGSASAGVEEGPGIKPDALKKHRAKWSGGTGVPGPLEDFHLFGRKSTPRHMSPVAPEGVALLRNATCDDEAASGFGPRRESKMWRDPGETNRKPSHAPAYPGFGWQGRTQSVENTGSCYCEPVREVGFRRSWTMESCRWKVSGSAVGNAKRNRDPRGLSRVGSKPPRPSVATTPEAIKSDPSGRRRQSVVARLQTNRTQLEG